MDMRAIESGRSGRTGGFAGITGAGGLGSADAPDGARGAGDTFGNLLGRMVENAEAKQGEATALAESVARGEPQDLHRVMTALNEADLSFRLVLEVRNKLVEAWQEIKRMPI